MECWEKQIPPFMTGRRVETILAHVHKITFSQAGSDGSDDRLVDNLRGLGWL